MKLSLIVAMAEGGVIGKGGQIPWDCPKDRAKFRELTMGSAVIMGRKTWESLPGPLDGRSNVVVSRTMEDVEDRQDVVVVRSPVEAVVTSLSWYDHAFVIGGAQIYHRFYSLADELHITHVRRRIDGDVAWSFNADEWEAVEREQLEPDVEYVRYVRKGWG